MLRDVMQADGRVAFGRKHSGVIGEPGLDPLEAQLLLVELECPSDVGNV